MTRADADRFVTQDIKPPQDSPLARWSRLKREAARAKEETKDSAAVAPTGALASAPTGAPASAPTDVAVPPTRAQASREVAESAPPSELPPVESLSFESDFAPFFQPQVDAALQRKALKQLLRDRHFNVMDGLDIYIGDYSQPDPISPEIVRQMVQGRYIFDPPPTRVNAQGHVEDIPPEEVAALRAAEEAKNEAALASTESTAATASAALEPSDAPGAEDPPAAAPDALSAKGDSTR